MRQGNEQDRSQEEDDGREQQIVHGVGFLLEFGLASGRGVTKLNFACLL